MRSTLRGAFRRTGIGDGRSKSTLETPQLKGYRTARGEDRAEGIEEQIGERGNPAPVSVGIRTSFFTVDTRTTESSITSSSYPENAKRRIEAVSNVWM